MSHLTNVLTAAALVGSFVCAGTATANADPTDTLAASLSKGYSSSNCKSTVGPSGVQAVIECGQNSDPSGPVFAKYLLFGSAGDLSGAFTSSIAADALANCGDVKSPSPWHQGASTDAAGQLACGTYQGQAEVIWTTDAKTVMSLIRASNGDTAALYTWWKANG
ncbi:serine/threonine protein kinase [Mycobacterium sp.]|uniref:serine/threonine protein kinase n=1 Tax=Mycobacterium sp. TaxID=1785 RepID=UPI002BF927D3|nr:serine/threonine protein kinase [Mycobacterium sp.]HTQ16888.1 serine/threonine protein kinase [Mycobacterium sp.]